MTSPDITPRPGDLVRLPRDTALWEPSETERADRGPTYLEKTTLVLVVCSPSVDGTYTSVYTGVLVNGKLLMTHLNRVRNLA